MSRNEWTIFLAGMGIGAVLLFLVVCFESTRMQKAALDNGYVNIFGSIYKISPAELVLTEKK